MCALLVTLRVSKSLAEMPLSYILNKRILIFLEFSTREITLFLHKYPERDNAIYLNIYKCQANFIELYNRGGVFLFDEEMTGIWYVLQRTGNASRTTSDASGLPRSFAYPKRRSAMVTWTAGTAGTRRDART